MSHVHYNWIHMWRFWIRSWIHDFMNSYFEFILPNVNSLPKCEFMNLISYIWFCDASSLLRIEDNSIFWIHDIEFSREICYMNLFLWICKNFNSDFSYEFINGLNLNSSINWICMNWWTWSHSRIDSCIHVELRSSSIQSTSTLLSLTVHSRFQLHWESASTAAFFTRPMNLINLETNKLKSSANQWVW